MKYVAALASPLIKSARTAARLRNADGTPLAATDLDEEMSAALDILALDARSGRKALGDYLLGKIADRPDVFDEDPVAQWIATETVQHLIKQAAYAFLRDEPIQSFADAAAAFFATFDGADGPGRGYAAFECAVPFVALSIANQLTVGDKVTLSAINGVNSLLIDAVSPIPLDLIDTYVVEQATEIRQARFFVGADSQGAARRLGARLLDGGDLSRASAMVRATGLASCARYLSRIAETTEAEGFLGVANRLAQTSEATVAKAFLLSQGDAAAGLRHLSPIDEPMKRTAALQIVLNRDGAAATVHWATSAGIDRTDLDADGLHVLISCKMEARDWDGAYADALVVSPEALADAPILQATCAIARLAHLVPDDLKAMATMGIPPGAASFPLSDTPPAMVERAVVAALLRGAQRSAFAFGLTAAATAQSTMAVWLDLRDPVRHAAARLDLEARLESRDPIAWVPLALAFGITLDLDRVEQALTRAEAFNPGGDAEIALARLAIALHLQERSVSEAADYFERHRSTIAANLNPAGVADIELKLLAAAGRDELARQRLDEATFLDDVERAAYDPIIAAGSTGPTLSDFETAYRDAPSTTALFQLVVALSEGDYSPRCFELAMQLISTTGSLNHARNLVNYLQRHERYNELETALEAARDLIDQSVDLRTAQAWSSYRAGDVKRSRQLLDGLRAERDIPNDRALHVNLLLSSGKWPELAVHVESEWAKQDERSAEELLRLAQLASQIRSPRVEALIALAAKKAPADPEILAGCYMISTQNGLEKNDTVHRWLDTAASLSDEKGPIQKADIDELIKQAPDWADHNADVWAKLKAGAIPLSVAARSLRRPSLELRLAAMLANRDEADPRRRSAVPAFSGLRGTLELTAASFILDGSSLVTLAMLDLLDLVIERGPIVVPHVTLSWLFAERQRLAFHQPSRIDFARYISRALSARWLLPFIPSAALDEKLAELIGSPLAAMLASAMARPNDLPQRLVVRSAPVLKLGSFRGQGVDLSAFSPVLCSCQAIVDKLAELGQLTFEEEQRARTYLDSSEQRWPDEPAIHDGAELLLDDLSVAYLSAAGILDKLRSAGFTARLPEREIEEANGLLALDGLAGDIERVVERIRSTLSAAIETGSVRLARLTSDDELKQHPDIGMLDLAGQADAIVTDDRYMNRVRALDSANVSTPLWTSLDILALLHKEGILSDDDLRRHRTSLRRAGLALFPSSLDELVALLGRSTLREGAMVETAELRAVRENLSLTQMRGWLRLPEEAEWLQKLSADLVDAIVAQWTSGIPDLEARARSNWLLARADMRPWSDAVTNNDGLNMATFGHVIPVSSLMLHRTGIARAERRRFDDWLEQDVLGPLKFNEPRIYTWLIEHWRNLVIVSGQGEANHAA